MEPSVAAVLIKIAGAFAGSGMALAFQPPSSWREFMQRLVFAIVSGALFADAVRIQYLKWEATWEMLLASSAMVSLISWWAFAGIVRVIGVWMPKDR